MKRYQEKRIRSTQELRRLIDALELDEGIRVLGALKGFEDGGFIFVTRSRGTYCVNFCGRVYEPSLGARVPGGKEEFHHVSSSMAVWDMIKGKSAAPFQAVIY